MAELDTLARTCWGEARGEGHEGMVAVAHVILNRVARGGWWGNTIEYVCRKPWQFSCWNTNDPNSAYLRGEKLIPRIEYEKALAAATQAMQDKVDPTGGATHYYAKSIKAPAWTVGAQATTRIGSHLFYKGVK